MSTAQQTTARLADPPPHPAADSGGSRWADQVWAVIGLELAKRVANRRSVWVLLLSAVPVALMSLMVFVASRQGQNPTLGEVTDVYAAVFEALILWGVVFLGCVGLFTSLFRAEMLQGSLHYYFLAPVRREVLVAGKYLSGLVVAVPAFGLSAVTAMAIPYIALASPGQRDLLLSLLVHHGLSYLAIVLLACLGYGAIFLFMGLAFRNPIIPAAAVFGWESVNFLLPPILKKVSVVHYLRSLRPVAVPGGIFAMLADPAPPPVAVGGLVAVAGLFLALSMLAVHRIEIDYGGE
jgi:ABC-type transport system involved in multi-copper enzyme maturation permease subunit